MTFHHLGVACENIEAEVERFQALGYRREGETFRDPGQKIEGAFLIGPGPRLELLAPMQPSSPVTPWLENGVKYYHQAFEVPSLTRAITGMLARRGVLVGPPISSVAFDGRPVAFVMLPGMILIELIQSAELGREGRGRKAPAARKRKSIRTKTINRDQSRRSGRSPAPK